MITLPTILVCAAIGLAIAAVVMLIIRGKLTSVRNVHTACNYERKGSFAVTIQQDAFLYRNIMTVPVPTSNSTSGSSGSRSNNSGAVGAIFHILILLTPLFIKGGQKLYTYLAPKLKK